MKLISENVKQTHKNLTKIVHITDEFIILTKENHSVVEMLANTLNVTLHNVSGVHIMKS